MKVKSCISAFIAVVFAFVMSSTAFSAQTGTYIESLTNEYDVNSDYNSYGLDCDNYPMLCQPILTGDFIQKWYCENWTENQWNSYFNKLIEAKIPMVVIQWTATVTDGKFSDIGFEPDADVAAYMSDSCTGNRNMLETMLKSAKSCGIKVMIGLTVNDEWWDTNKNQSESWYTAEANLVNKVAKCIYDGYYERYSDVICGWYWAYEMWSCNSSGESHLETQFANMLNLTIDYLNNMDASLPIMVCPFISKYYGTENASSCWREFFEKIRFRDGDIIAPQDCFTSCGYDLATVESHIKAMSDARKYCNADVQFWIDVENYNSENVNDYIKQLRICAKYATRLIAFSYAHYFAQDSQAQLHSDYVDYTNDVTSVASITDSQLYEAENATLSGSGVSIINDYNASGGKAVGQFSSSDSKVTFNVTVSNSGYYDIILVSKGSGSDKINNVLVNNSNVGTFSSIQDIYSESTVSRIYLRSGENAITISKSWGYIYLDYIKLIKQNINTSEIYNVSKQLINPNATDSAKRLMSYICDNYGKNVLSGQQADKAYQSNEAIAIKNATGKLPAVIGLDLLDYSLSSVTQHGTRGKSIDKAIEVDNAGGIVTMCWHWRMYDEYLLSGTDNGNPRWWGAFYTKNIDTSKFNLSKIMNDPSCKEYQLILKDIDYAAQQLKRLQDNDIPVLFRPLHEASGGWFWWGSAGPEPCKRLWKLMYDRLTNYHGLNNLIWVWNGQDPSWYPGDEYVDIMGEDIYPGTHQYSPQSSKFLEVADYSTANKVVTLSENGCLFDVDQAISAGTLWSWFCVWGGNFASNGTSISTQYTELEMWKKVYQHENVITLDEVPDLKSYPIDEDVQGTPEHIGTNLTLTGIIGANVYYTVPEGYLNSNYKVEAVFTANGIDPIRVSLDKNKTETVSGKKAYVFTLPVKSYEMSKRFRGKLVISTVSGKEVLSTDTVTIMLNSFATSMGSTGTEKEKAFAKAMQTYGYYSQKALNKTDSLPSVSLIDISDVTHRNVRNYAPSTVALSGGTEKGAIFGTSLYLDSGTGVISYVKDLSGVNTNNLYMQYTVNGKTERVKAKYSSENKAYYGVIADVSAENLSKMYDICFCEGTTPITSTARYGAYSYIYSTLRTSDSTDMQNVVKAMYKYSLAAEALMS